MNAVVQRVLSASVVSGGVETGRISRGLAVLVGFHTDDPPTSPPALAEKIVNLRIFEDDSGRMGRSVLDIAGGVLAVPNFTLCASIAKGRRPSFDPAAPPAVAEPLFDSFVDALRAQRLSATGAGVFGADMVVSIENDGPVTLVVTNNDLRLTR